MKHSTGKYAMVKGPGATMFMVSACFFGFAAMAVIAASGAISVKAANSGDPVRGKELFEKRCGGCHSLDTNKEGPRLRNVYGRRAGSISNFTYSDAMKGAQVTWDHALLDKWLTNTESVVPDNDMEFHVSKAEDRADIIEYLRVSSGK